jgi:hypothetical protein
VVSSPARAVAVAGLAQAATRALVITLAARTRAAARTLAAVRLPAVTAAPTVARPAGGTSGRAARAVTAAIRARTAWILVAARILVITVRPLTVAPALAVAPRFR